MDHEEYYARYDNLSHMIRRAYTLLYSIEAIGDPGTPTLNPFNAMEYIYEILKYMLGLTIWQIYYDTNPSANTLSRLHNKIVDNRIETPKKTLEKYRKEMNAIRNEYLAHNDIEKSGKRILIADLSKLLDELRKWLNSLCRPDLDSRVSEITDDELDVRKGVIYAGFQPLLGRRKGAGE